MFSLRHETRTNVVSRDWIRPARLSVGDNRDTNWQLFLRHPPVVHMCTVFARLTSSRLQLCCFIKTSTNRFAKEAIRTTTADTTRFHQISLRLCVLFSQNHLHPVLASDSSRVNTSIFQLFDNMPSLYFLSCKQFGIISAQKRQLVSTVSNLCSTRLSTRFPLFTAIPRIGHPLNLPAMPVFHYAVHPIPSISYRTDDSGFYLSSLIIRSLRRGMAITQQIFPLHFLSGWYCAFPT